MSEAPLEPEAPLWEDAPPRPRTPWVTYAVLVVCVAIWAGIRYSGDPDSEEVLLAHGYADGWDIWDGAWWSLITSAFVHVDVFHMLFNMLFLWILGRALERSIGPARWLGFIVLTAFVSSAAELAASENTGLGFSGVLYAVFSFMWLARPCFPSFRIATNPWVVFSFLGGLVLVFVPGSADYIANSAHVSGLICGALLGYAVLPTRKRAAMIAGVTLLTVASFVPLVWMPWSPWWTTYMAVEAHYDDKLEEAIGWYRKALELGGYDVEWTKGQLAVVEARLAHAEERYEDAVRWYRRVIELEHEDELAWAWSNLAIIQWFIEEEGAAAERSLAHMGEHDEQAAAALRAAFHGDKAWGEERFEDAARLLQRSADLGEDLDWVHIQLVESYGKLGDLEKRALALKRLRKLHPDAEVEPAPPQPQKAPVETDGD